MAARLHHESAIEVKRMRITAYNEARTRAEDREEGRLEGRLEGRIELLARLVRKGILNENEAAEEAGMPLGEFRSKVALIPNCAQ